eukprot:GILI01008138.1.p1 GENE.GILI01008138.1~~GILI01008138.1.p1  ORF type:complete len:496 (+),score=96.33 GILI01008138.1:45-1532(+)
MDFLGSIVGAVGSALEDMNNNDGRGNKRRQRYGFGSPFSPPGHMGGGHFGGGHSNQGAVTAHITQVFGPMAFLQAQAVPRSFISEGYRGSSAVRPSAPYRVTQPYTAGRVRGLFVGINYKGSASELSGCVNDVSMMLKMLETIGFPMQESCILVDDPSFPGNSGSPTRDNIIKHMQWLVSDAKAGDCFFFHYSGHGSQTQDKSGDEEDGMDETLVPVDYRTAGCIIDDDIYAILCQNLPPGVRLTAVMDCCHSGTLMDLPYFFEATSDNMSDRSIGGAALRLGRRNDIPCKAEVIMLSGCSDTQTSADVSNISSFGNQTSSYAQSMAGGACTNALTQVLTKTSGLTYVALFKEMRAVLQKKRYTQVPQLTASQPINLNKPFSLFMSGGSPQPQQQSYPQAAQGYQQYPSQGSQYPPAQYPPQQQGYYPPQGYPPQQQGYPPQQYRDGQYQYPPQQQGAYPAPQGYPPQGYPPQQGYPQQQGAYPPQNHGYQMPSF